MTIDRDTLLRLLREDPTLVDELRKILFGVELKLLAEIGEQLRETAQFLATSAQEFDRRMETMRQEFRQELAEMRQEFQRQISELRAEVEEARRRAEEVHAECDRRISEAWIQIQITQRTIAEVLERLDAREKQWASLAQRHSRLAGMVLEIRYHLNPYGFFGEIVRKARWVTGDELDELIERAMEAGLLTPEERRELVKTDLIVLGIREGKQTWLAVEVSGVLDYDDLHRAIRRSQLLERITNEPAIPVIAGELCSEDLLRAAKFNGVWVLLDGRLYSPERAQGD